MLKINELGYNEQTTKRTTVYPMAKVAPFMFRGYPAMQFSYDGMLPTYKETDFEYTSMIRHYYYRATFDSYDYSKLKLPLIEEAVIIFVNYFTNKVIRDLDNRNKKYIQDAIRLANVINDDNWQYVWNMDIGFLDKEKSHVQVYVVPKGIYPTFIKYLMENHEQLKKTDGLTELKLKYEKNFIEQEYQKAIEIDEELERIKEEKEYEETMFF